MQVTYTPKGGAPLSWPYKPLDVRQSEAEMMEKRAGGLTWDELNKGILSNKAACRKVLLWHCLRLDHPLMRWEDVPDFAMGELKVEFDTGELAGIREGIEAMPDGVDDNLKAMALKQIDLQLADAPVADPKAQPSESDSPISA